MDDDLQLKDISENTFVQWVADNIDHNVATMTGKGTFPGMVIIIIREGPLHGQFGNIPRLKERKKAHSVTAKRRGVLTQIRLELEWIN